MIKNEKQYKITRSRLKDFERSLKVCREGTFPSKVIHKLMIDSLKSKMKDLEEEIRKYENLKNKQVPTLKFGSLKDLPQVLVCSRISHGLTQKQLAEKLGMPAQQIQRYESEDYRRVSFETLLSVSKTLNVDLDRGAKVRIVYGATVKNKPVKSPKKKSPLRSSKRSGVANR